VKRCSKYLGVGNPEQPDGSVNLSYIATVARQIAETVEKGCLVVVKSIVPVGIENMRQGTVCSAPKIMDTVPNPCMNSNFKLVTV
jgi:UDP-glucose 6-dehydrogenase